MENIPPQSPIPLEQKEKISLRILIADDQEMLRDMLATQLQSMGHIVDIVSDGRELVNKLTSEYNCDFVITDFEMPKMNGLQAFEAVRKIEKYKNLPFLIVTGNPYGLEDEMTKKNLVVPYLDKPYGEDQLSAKIEELRTKS